jgi:hypothetical protein
MQRDGKVGMYSFIMIKYYIQAIIKAFKCGQLGTISLFIYYVPTSYLRLRRYCNTCTAVILVQSTSADTFFFKYYLIKWSYKDG